MTKPKRKRTVREMAEEWWDKVQRTDPTAGYGSWFQVGGFMVGYRRGFHDGKRKRTL